MKKLIFMIAGLFLVSVFFVMCEKDKHVKPEYKQFDVKKALIKKARKQGVPLTAFTDVDYYGKCDIIMTVINEGSGHYKGVVKLSTAHPTVTRTVQAISMVIDIGSCTVSPLGVDNYTIPSLHVDLQSGTYLWNINNNKLYFSWYSLIPLNLTLYNLPLFEIYVKKHFVLPPQPATLNFNTVSGNNVISINGYNDLIMTYNNATF